MMIMSSLTNKIELNCICIYFCLLQCSTLLSKQLYTYKKNLKQKHTIKCEIKHLKVLCI